MKTNEQFNPLDESIDSLYNRASELARVTWDAIRDLPKEELEFIRNALSERFLHSRPERVLIALDLLRRVEEAIGRIPSAARYDDYRKLHPELDLRSATFIRNTFGGSWKNAIAAYLGEPMPNILRKRLTSGVSIYTDEDLLDYVREFIEIHKIEWKNGQPTLVCPSDEISAERRTVKCISQSGFRTYARHQEHVLSRRFPSQEMINFRFSGWQNAVIAATADMKDGALRVVVLDTVTSRDDRQFQIGELVKACAEEIRHAPDPADFDDWLMRLLDRNDLIDPGAARAWIALRTSDDAVRSFKSWNQGLVSAGLIEQQFVQPRRIYKTPDHRFTAEEILAWVALARSEIKGRLNDRSFNEWRRARLDIDDSVPIPSGRTVRHRFGSFENALSFLDSEAAAA